MNILRATHLGMCFGVRDAITLAKQTAARQSVTVLGQLVHNRDVLADLQSHGIRFAEHADRTSTDTILITAHGASDRRINAARATGRNVMEATCPLVHHAHRELRMLLAAGFHPVIVGRRGHVEVNGLTEDLAECDVVLTEEDVDQLTPRSRFGVIAQTTQPLDRVQRLVQLMCQRFPQSEVVFRDTVCRPTKDRQSAATELARQSDVVIVIGGDNSNNTRELVATCSRHCTRVKHAQSAADLRSDWFQPDDTVGITAGTSTPDWVIDAVEQALRAFHTATPAPKISRRLIPA
jgi:4-hydroxy-3-methylbut-2-enyl diphosphate reductase